MPDAKKPREEGLRSMKFTNLFKATNFELFAKPNKIVMAVGAALFGLSMLYMLNMPVQNPNQQDFIDSGGPEKLMERLILERKPGRGKTVEERDE